MHSTAQASGMADASLPPTVSHAARQRTGRMRLPPAKMEYRMALWIVGGAVVSGGNSLSSAASTRAHMRSRYWFRLKTAGDFNCAPRLPTYGTYEGCYFKRKFASDATRGGIRG